MTGKPDNSDAWLRLLGGEYAGTLDTREQRLCRALERLHLGLVRERAAWLVLLNARLGFGARMRGTQKALAGTVQWPEGPKA